MTDVREIWDAAVLTGRNLFPENKFRKIFSKFSLQYIAYFVQYFPCFKSHSCLPYSFKFLVSERGALI